MKKIILSLTVFIGFAIVSQAQVKLGYKYGVNLSNQKSNAATGTKLISIDAFRGYHIGFVADLWVAEHFYLQPHLLYSQKGAKYTTNVGSVETKLTMRNIEMPVNILYKTTLPYFKLFAGGGPVLNYAFNGKIRENGSTTKLNSNMKNWKRLDISANVVAGIEFNNGFFTSVNYQLGLKDMSKEDGINTKNRLVSISVGYMLNLKTLKGKG